MKQKMVYVGISYGIGLFFASFLNSSGVFLHLAIITFALLGLKFLCKFNIKEITVCTVSFAVGLGVYVVYNNNVYRQSISYADSNIYNISGKITEITNYDGDMSQYKIKATINETCNTNIIFYGDTTTCQYGDQIQLKSTLKQFENTYKFSAEDYYKSKNIFLQVDEVSEVNILHSEKFSPIRVLLNYRSQISDKITQILPNQEGKILVGMLFGEKTTLDNSVKTAFYRTGIGHIMSVSGLHLVVLASLVLVFLNKLKVHRYMRFITVEILILIFCICTGMAISVIRSAIMLTLIYSAELFQRRADTLNSLSISIILLTITSPFTIKDPSFLLSIAGVYGIGVVAPYISADIKGGTRSKKLLKNIMAMFCVTLVVLPVSMMYFNETSIISPIANLLLIPLCELALICGILVFFTGGLSFIAYPLLSLGGICCRVVCNVSEYIAKLPYTHMPLDYKFFKVTVVMLMFFSIITFAIFRQRKILRMSLIIWIPVFMITSVCYNFANRDVLSIAILGQNKNNVAIVISKGGNNDIIDLTGTNKTVDYVSSYIAKCGINRIGTLAMRKKPYAIMTSYTKTLQNLSVSNVILPNNTYILNGAEVCRNEPVLSAFSNTEIKYSNYNIKFMENGAIIIKYGDYEFMCIDNKSQIIDIAPKVLLNYGDYSGEIFECGYLIILDKITSNVDNVISGENNILITCDKKGNIKVRRLE